MFAQIRKLTPSERSFSSVAASSKVALGCLEEFNARTVSDNLDFNVRFSDGFNLIVDAVQHAFEIGDVIGNPAIVVVDDLLVRVIACGNIVR